jgi:hypothetical protein
MDLRDFFAAHLAAALAHRVDRPAAIAARAYELADALLVERARGLVAYGEEQPLSDEELEGFFAAQGAPISDFVKEGSFFRPEGLLDEPAPIEENDEELDAASYDPNYDPRWDVEPKWEEPPRSERPGLARTTPVVAEPKKRQA